MPKQIYEVTFGGKLAWHFLVPVLSLSWEILQNTSVALCESGIRMENALISRLCTCLHVYFYREQSETSHPWILCVSCHILQLDGVILANNLQQTESNQHCIGTQSIILNLLQHFLIHVYNTVYERRISEWLRVNLWVIYLKA